MKPEIILTSKMLCKLDGEWNAKIAILLLTEIKNYLFLVWERPRCHERLYSIKLLLMNNYETEVNFGVIKIS